MQRREFTTWFLINMDYVNKRLNETELEIENIKDGFYKIADKKYIDIDRDSNLIYFFNKYFDKEYLPKGEKVNKEKLGNLYDTTKDELVEKVIKYRTLRDLLRKMISFKEKSVKNESYGDILTLKYAVNAAGKLSLKKGILPFKQEEMMNLLQYTETDYDEGWKIEKIDVIEVEDTEDMIKILNLFYDSLVSWNYIVNGDKIYYAKFAKMTNKYKESQEKQQIILDELLDEIQKQEKVEQMSTNDDEDDKNIIKLMKKYGSMELIAKVARLSKSEEII